MSDEITVSLRPGHIGSESPVDIKITPDYADDLAAMLDDAGLGHSEAVEFSATDEVLRILAVSTGTGAAVAQVLRAFYHRHQSKRFDFSSNGTKITVQGGTVEEFERAVEIAIEQKHVNEAGWAKYANDGDES
jgi:hypothetical protein